MGIWEKAQGGSLLLSCIGGSWSGGGVCGGGCGGGMVITYKHFCGFSQIVWGKFLHQSPFLFYELS